MEAEFHLGRSTKMSERNVSKRRFFYRHNPRDYKGVIANWISKI